MNTPSPAATSGTPAIELIAAAKTHVGLERKNNEDSMLVIEGALFAVADGMGGHAAGEIASQTIVDTLAACFASSSGPLDADEVEAAIHEANRAVIAKGMADHTMHGLGSTLVALSVGTDPSGSPVLTAHNIGDSRCYLLRNGELTQITEDDTPVQEMVNAGLITKAQARTHWERNYISRAIGLDARAIVTRTEIAPQIGDRFVLCSDGLNGYVTDEDIEMALATIDGPAAIADELVELALLGGGGDNVTVIVVEVTAPSAG